MTITRVLQGLALLMIAAGTCLAAPAARRHAPAKSHSGVVKRLVRLTGPSHASRAPVSITVVPGPVVGTNRQRVRVSVTPRVDAPRVEIEVVARDGLGIAQGPSHWEVPARASATISKDLILTVTGPGQRRLVVTASLKFDDGTILTGVEAVAFNPPASAGEQIPGAREVITPDGKRLLEVPLQGVKITPKQSRPTQGSR